jgi:Glycosyl transferase family 2/Polysaccharide pyruvyl transferase
MEVSVSRTTATVQPMTSTPRARVLIYNQTTNIGDAIQTAAIARLLGGTCAGVYRDAPVPDAYADTPFVVNGWLGWQAPANEQNCFFAGIHLGEREPEFISWIRKSSAPAGARDDYTAGLLASHRVASEVVGCPTLTFRRYTGKRSGRYSVDVFPVAGTQYETSVIPTDLPWPEQWTLALERLDQLRKAEIVYTRRLHVILPCLAFGTPVVFPSKELRDIFDKSRLSILHWLGFPYDEVVQMDVSGVAERYVQFLSRILDRRIDPVERPEMPAPIIEESRPRVFETGAVSSSLKAHLDTNSPLVTAVVLTKNGAARLPRCLESIRRSGFADETVVCVDRDSTDNSLDVARSFTSQVHLVEGGSLESALPEMVSLCSGSFILRLDDDECLGGTWDPEQFRLLTGFNRFTHVLTPCRWIVPPGDAFICSHPWFPDLKCRLFRNAPDLISWPRKVHEPMAVLGPPLVLFDRWIDHFALVLRSRIEREQKCAEYLKRRPDLDLSQFYLWEGHPVRLLSRDASGFAAATVGDVGMHLGEAVRAYRPGSEIAFHLHGNADDYQVSGWSGAEAWGTWTVGDEAEICLSLADPVHGNAVLIAEAAAYVTPEHPCLRVEVVYRNETLGVWDFENANCVRKTVTIPGASLAGDTRLRFRFRIMNPASPSQFGRSDDTRLLGLGFRRLWFDCSNGIG